MYWPSTLASQRLFIVPQVDALVQAKAVDALALDRPLSAHLHLPQAFSSKWIPVSIENP